MPPPTGPKTTAADYAADYAAAQSTVKAGHIIKIAAAVVAAGITLFSGFILCLAIVTASSSTSPVTLLFGIAGICGGIATGLALYAIGTLVSTAGRILTATLDTAVHTAALGSDSRVIAFRPSIVRERADHAP